MFLYDACVTLMADCGFRHWGCVLSSFGLFVCINVQSCGWIYMKFMERLCLGTRIRSWGDPDPDRNSLWLSLTLWSSRLFSVLAYPGCRGKMAVIWLLLLTSCYPACMQWNKPLLEIMLLWSIHCSGKRCGKSQYGIIARNYTVSTKKQPENF